MTVQRIGGLKRYDWPPSAGGFTEDNTNIEQKQIKAAIHNELFYYKSITIKPVTKHTFFPLHNTASQGTDINTNLQPKKKNFKPLVWGFRWFCCFLNTIHYSMKILRQLNIFW